MADVIVRNTPVSYELRRIGLQLNAAGQVVALADLAIRNGAGQVIDDDHPQTTLTEDEEQAFRSWVLGKLAAYEAATGLARYAGGG